MLFQKPFVLSDRLRRARRERLLRDRGLLPGFKPKPASTRRCPLRARDEVAAGNDALRESIARRRILSLTL